VLQRATGEGRPFDPIVVRGRRSHRRRTRGRKGGKRKTRQSITTVREEPRIFAGVEGGGKKMGTDFCKVYDGGGEEIKLGKHATGEKKWGKGKERDRAEECCARLRKGGEKKVRSC